jgi:hypothetical protein
MPSVKRDERRKQTNRLRGSSLGIPKNENGQVEKKWQGKEKDGRKKKEK